MMAAPRFRSGGLSVFLTACALLALPGVLSAQSLLSGYGFGSPMESLDARALALGGMGMGLTGTELTAHDPAAAADLSVPAILFTTQTSWIDAQEGGQGSTFTATRFPAMGIMYPVRGVGTVSLAFAGVLDQTWTASQERVLTLEGGPGTQARVTDTFESKGGVSALRLGLARRLSPQFAVGATVGTYMGSLTRQFTRSFDSLEVETSVPDYEIGGFWEYSGFIASLGATAELGGIARVSGSYSLGGELSADPTSDTDGGALAVSMPSEFRIGASAMLSDRLNLSAGVLLADWSEAGRDLPGVEGSSVLRLGGGVEWTGASLLGKPSSVRVGYRRGALPFRREGDPQITESVVSGGLGMNLLQSGELLLARTDFTVERGSRDAGVFSEEFWRMVVTLRVSGF